VATAKVKPNARPYTGTSDGIAKARRAGMDEWIKQAIAASDNTLNNLGSYMVRDQKGHKGVLSVHSTGRAVDLGFTNRKAALKFINTVARNANDLGVECILDYFPRPFGSWLALRPSNVEAIHEAHDRWRTWRKMGTL
jgi:hypothetical protein